MSVALVIPTIRPEQTLGMLAMWEKQEKFWDQLYVVQDGQEKFLDDWANWETIEGLQDKAWIISKKDSAIRCYGFYQAYKDGHDIIVTLDDDCFPLGPMEDQGHVQYHLDLLRGRGPKVLNTVDGLPMRGLPYDGRGSLEVTMNVGLWEGVPDLDGITQMQMGYPLPRLDLSSYVTRYVPNGGYIPMCGMNLAFHRRLLPAMYFPLQGLGRPYQRFDDIWCGWMAQKVCHQMGWLVSWGQPFVYHSRASDPIMNREKEAAGLPLNERLWQVIDAIDITHCTTASNCVREIVSHPFWSDLDGEDESYWKTLREAYYLWTELFDET